MLKKLFMILALVTLILSFNVVFAENENLRINETNSDIYVSNEGSDNFGDGSELNPYQTLNYTIEKAQNNSNIYLKSGVYNSTGYTINKNLFILGIGEVILDGRNGEFSQNIFTINENSSLFLSNMHFINGYSDLDGEILSCIVNKGELYISNSTFDNFKTSIGVIKNENYLYIDDVKTSNLYNSDLFSTIYQSNMKIEFIFNVGQCYAFKLNTSTIYNNKNMYLYNSTLEQFISNKKYDNQFITNYLDNSRIKLLTVSNCDMLILNNSYINCNFQQQVQHYPIETHLINNSNIIIENSIFSKNEFYNYALNIIDSNVTAFSTQFFTKILFDQSNANITYSNILNSISCFGHCEISANLNWWGNNKGPIIYSNSYSNIDANYWVVMKLEEDENLTFKVEMTKYTNGINLFDLVNSYCLPSNFVKFEAESGYFSKKEGYLINGTFSSSLINNNPNTIIYATIDNQILRLAVGSGLSDYTIYISNDRGNDYFYDGSYDYPYKTISKAVSKSFSGNKIYILSGFYTLSWNANIVISKNLTIIGIGEVTLARPNMYNIFIVNSKGELNIENINFTVATIDSYYDSLIVLDRGNLNVKNCNFYDIACQSVIMAKNNEFIHLNNVSFDNIRGSAILGFSNNLFVNNSKFTNGNPIYLQNYYYGYTGTTQYNLYGGHIHFYIALSGNITILNSIFNDNIQGAVGYYVSSIQEDFWNIEGLIPISRSFIYNTTFENNNWDKEPQLIMGLAIGDNEYQKGYSVIDNCLFFNNIGHLMFATDINNSIFINNTATPYLLRTDANFQHMAYYIYPKALISANNINNSYFYGNSYISKDYDEKIVYANEVYYSSFIKNTAAFGGALSNSKEVHYCVFVNNTGIYGANDIFVYNGNLNCSSNWWGSNQEPKSDRINVFLGSLVLENWIIMSIYQEEDYIFATLDTLIDSNNNRFNFNYTLPSREVLFSSEHYEISINNSSLKNNTASTKLIKNSSLDFNVYAKIDNQILSLTVYNNSTQLIIKNMTVYGKGNKYDLSLININGHRISNQNLNIIVRYKNSVIDSFTITTDDWGNAYFDIEYPVGIYEISVYYFGNGYFEKCNGKIILNVSSISTHLISYNYTYYGKNNKFYSILIDNNGKYVLNQKLTLNIFDFQNQLISSSNVMTGEGGRANVLISLNTGDYRLVWLYPGNEWYEFCSSESYVSIKPINTTIILPDSTIYGKGKDYKLLFKDIYENVISGETILITISNSSESKQFKLITDDEGIATININLVPGTYNLNAEYVGDDVYGSYSISSILNICPVFVLFDFNSHPIISENGIFTVIVKDMYGGKVIGQTIELELSNMNIQKSYIAVTDARGEANFKVDLLDGIYFGMISYGGNIWYNEASGAVSLTVTHNSIVNSIYLNSSDFVQYYGENKYFKIDFNDTSAYTLEGKIISVIISSDDWSKAYDVESDIFGNARIQITLDSGIYNITSKYNNEYYGLYASTSSIIRIYDMPTNLISSNLIMNYGEPRNLEIKLINKNGNPIGNKFISINVDNEYFNISTNQNGIAKLLLDLEIGYHIVNYSFKDKNYIESNGSIIVYVVNESKTATNLVSNLISNNENQSINLTVYLSDLLNNPISSSEIILNILDNDKNLIDSFVGYTNSEGIFSFNFKLKPGNYITEILYNGNDFYLPYFNTNNFYIKSLENSIETILYGNDCEVINADKNTNYFVILATSDGKFIKDQEIEFIVNNVSYYGVTDEFGRAYLNVSFSQGVYKVLTKFNGSINMTETSIINYITVKGNLFNLYSRDIVKSYNNGTHYYVGLFDANNLPLVDKLIKFLINGKIYETRTDNFGFACFEVWLKPGIYKINATYQEQYSDEVVSVENEIIVLTSAFSNNVVKYYGDQSMLMATFWDYNGEFLKNYDIVFNLNGVDYKIKTNQFGIAFLNINLNSGKHFFTIINTKTGQKETYSIVILSTVISNNLIKYYKGSSNFVVLFKDFNGDPLKNTIVKFKIKSKIYKVKTDLKGMASLKINFKPGVYTISIINTKTCEIHKNSIKILSTIISKNKKIKSSKKTNFKVKILNSKGKLVKKAKVMFIINGKRYYKRTNSKGISTLNIKLKKGSYNIYTQYNGLKIKNRIIVK